MKSGKEFRSLIKTMGNGLIENQYVRVVESKAIYLDEDERVGLMVQENERYMMKIIEGGDKKKQILIWGRIKKGSQLFQAIDLASKVTLIYLRLNFTQIFDVVYYPLAGQYLFLGRNKSEEYKFEVYSEGSRKLYKKKPQQLEFLVKLMNCKKDFLFIGNFGSLNLITVKNVNNSVNLSVIGIKEGCFNEEGDEEYVTKATLIGFIKQFVVDDCHLE